MALEEEIQWLQESLSGNPPLPTTSKALESADDCITDNDTDSSSSSTYAAKESRELRASVYLQRLGGEGVTKQLGLSSLEIEAMLHHLKPPLILLEHDVIEGDLAFLMLLTYLHGPTSEALAKSADSFCRTAEEVSLAVVTVIDSLIRQWGHLLDLLNAHRYHLNPRNIELLTWKGDRKVNKYVVPETSSAVGVQALPMGTRKGGLVWGFLASRPLRFLTKPPPSSSAEPPKPSDWPMILLNNGLFLTVGPLPAVSSSVSHARGMDRPLQDWLLRNSTTDPLEAEKNNRRSTPPAPDMSLAPAGKRAYLWCDCARDRYGQVIGEIPTDLAWRRFLTPPSGAHWALTEELCHGALADLFPLLKAAGPGKNARLLLADVYLVAMLIFNCKVCISGNERMAAYKRTPPSIQEYLLPRHSEHVDRQLPSSYDV